MKREKFGAEEGQTTSREGMGGHIGRLFVKSMNNKRFPKDWTMH